MTRGRCAATTRRSLPDLRQPQAREPRARRRRPAGARGAEPQDRVLRLRRQHLGRGRLEPGDQEPPGPEPPPRPAVHPAHGHLGLVPVRDRAVHPARHGRHLGRRLRLRPEHHLPQPAGQPAGRAGRRRVHRALPHRPLPLHVAGLGRLAPRRARAPGPPRADQQGGPEDRRRVPGRPSRRDHLPPVPSRGARPAGARAAGGRDPRGGAGRRRAGRHDRVHALAVQPGLRAPGAHVGRPARRRGGPGRGVAVAARPSVRVGAEGGAVHPHHRDAPRVEPGAPAPASSSSPCCTASCASRPAPPRRAPRPAVTGGRRR